MNQRIKKARDRKNNIDGSTMSTGGYIVTYSRNEDPVVRTPQKVTGDIKPEQTKSNLEGLAKASPNFKQFKKVEPKSKFEEKKVVAESIEDKKDEEKE